MKATGSSVSSLSAHKDHKLNELILCSCCENKTLLYKNLHIFTSTTIFHLCKDYLFSLTWQEIRIQRVK